MSSTGSVRTSPTRGIIKNPCPPKTREGIKPVNEIYTCNAQSDEHLFLGNNTGAVCMINKATTERRMITVADPPAPVRAIGIGKERAVIVFGGCLRMMSLNNAHTLGKVVDLKQYLGTDRSSSGFARFAAMRSDNEVFAVIFGDGEFVVVRTRGMDLMKRSRIQNNGPRGICFVGAELYAFDEQNRGYILEY